MSRGRTKRRLAAVVAVVWAVLLVPIAIMAFADTPLTDAVGIVDQIATQVFHLFHSPENDVATIGDAVSTTYLPLQHVDQNDAANIGDSVLTHIFYLLHSSNADSATLVDQVSISFVVQATSTTLQTSANPGVYGSSLSLTATITASNLNPGAADGTVTFKDGSTTLCNAQPLTANQATCTTSQLVAGSHSLTANYSGTTRYSPSSGTLTEQVAPAPLTITADDKAKLYAAADPTFTVAYSGFVNADTPATLTGTLAFVLPAASSPVGVYAGQIVPSGLSSSNYAIAFVNGTLTITPAPLTVRADDAARVYGAANPTFTVSYAGLVNGDGPGAMGGILRFTAPPANSGVGTYTGQVVPSGLTSTNYTITFVAGTLSIAPAPLVVTANDASRFYGQPEPAFSLSVSGLVNGDAQPALGTPLFTTPALRTSPVGAYPVTPSGLTNPNYGYAYVTGTLRINPAPTATALTATPNPAIVHRPVTLTATVTTTAPNGLNPSSIGAVSFSFGSTVLGSQSIDANGVASLTVSTLPIGRDTVTATYADPAPYLGSTSALLVVQMLQNRIFFSSNRDGNLEIYSMTPDGTDQVRLTSNPAEDTNPAVSPDGSKVAFVSNRGGSIQIWVINADGSNPRQLTTGSCLAATPAWSPDGKKIAFTSLRSGSVQIWIVATDGAYPNAAASQLTPNTFASANTTPAWSPDGKTIAFTSTRSGLPQIWTMKADGSGTPAQLTSNTFALLDTMPAWSPDGTQIAFTSSRPGLAAIYLMSANGTSSTRLTNDGPATDATPTWSTDGKQLAFTTTIGGVVAIYLINSDGTGPTRLTSGPAINVLPSWSTPVAP